MNRLAMLCAAAVIASAPMPTEADTAVWKANAGGDITVGDNWASGSAPAAGDILDFSAITSAQTLTGGFADDRVFAHATFGTGVATLAGNLHLATLTNALNLAVGADGVLVVDEDLVYYSDSYASAATFLYSNAGRVTVKGDAVCSTGAKVYMNTYATLAGCQPMSVGGLKYDCRSNTLYYRLSFWKKTGEWIIGSRGLSFAYKGNGANLRYILNNADALLHSSADWSIRNSNRSRTTGGDVFTNGNKLTIDTSDYNFPDDASKAHVVTLNGRIYEPKTSGTSVEIRGCGTFVINTSSIYDIKYTCISNTLAVTDTATLQINANAAYEIANVNLAAGTTLSMPSTSATAIAAPTLPSVTLPADGKAQLRIDGPELKPGEYTVLSSVPDGYASHLSVVGTALGTRSARLSDDGASLKMTVLSKGLTITIR